MKNLVLIFILSLAACTTQTKQRGFIFPDGLESEIAGAKTTAELEKKLGSPQARTAYGENIWMYYGVDENHRGPFPIIYDNKKALLVWSDGSGRITAKRMLEDKDFPRVEIDPAETPIPAAIELNALEELVNNVGRFTPAGLGQ